MNDEEDIDDEVEGADEPSRTMPKPSSNITDNESGGGPGKVNTTKDKARRLGKTIKEGIKKGAELAKEFATIKYKLIILAIVVVVFLIGLGALWLATEMEETQETSSSIDRAMSGNTISGNTMSEASSTFYQNSGSLVMANNDDLNLIEEEYNTELSDKNSIKTRAFSKIYSGGDTSSTLLEGAADVNDSKSFYQHALSTEKYNFNRIKWRAYTRANLAAGAEPSGTIKMKLDSNTGLQYPEYQGDLDGQQELDYYLTILYPYLQSWIIPLSLVSGTTSGGDDDITEYSDAYNTRFGYEIIAQGYHKITYDRFELYTRKKSEDYREYDEFNVAGTVQRTCTTYKIGVDENGAYVSPTDSNAKSVQTHTACKDAAATFDPVDPNAGTKYVEFPDKMSTSEYNIKSYYDANKADATKPYTEKTNASLTNKDLGDTADYQYDITSYQAFDIKLDKQYEFTAYDLTLPENTAEESSTPFKTEAITEGGKTYTAKNESAPAWASNANATATSATSTVNLNKKIQEGETVNVQRSWMDQLSVGSVESGDYTIEDIEAYVGEPLSELEKNYYQELIDEDNDGINLVDMLNAKPESYEKYLRNDEPYSTHIGYTRDYLSVSYGLLKDYMKDMSENFSRSFMWGGTIVPFLSTTIAGEGITGETLIVSGVNIIYPFTSEEIKAGHLHLQDTPKGGGAYGYAGHTGIDISYDYDAADKTLCNDKGMTEYKKCPYIKGPKVYTIMEGTITEVQYSECNTYYKTGHCSDDAYIQALRPKANPNLTIRTSAWATAVTVESDDGTKTIYYHLYPDFEFYNNLSLHVGEKIPIGTLVGYMGNTGKSSGMHLHIENGTTLWQTNGSRTLDLLRKGLNNTTGKNIYQTTTTPGLSVGTTTPMTAGNYTWYNLPEGLDPTTPPPDSVVVEKKNMKATIYGLFGDVGGACTAGAASYTDADGTHPYCKDQLGTSYSVTPTFIEAAKANMLPRVVANAYQQNGNKDEIPQGTLIYIKSNKAGVEDYGYAMVADRGGGVSVGSLDLYMHSVYDDKAYSKFNLGINAHQYWNLTKMGDITVYVTSYKIDRNKPIYIMKKGV